MIYSDHEQAVFTECADAWLHEELISLECAMTIASWWHSPTSPNSTRLSTMGEVSEDASLSDFVTEEEYRTADPKHRMALESLDRFITDVLTTRKRYASA